VHDFESGESSSPGALAWRNQRPPSKLFADYNLNHLVYVYSEKVTGTELRALIQSTLRRDFCGKI
jgi:hypothetical protein